MGRPATGLRKKVLDAARELVLTEGAATLTLDAVVAKAGVSKGGLLYQFPSKQKLLAELTLHLLEEFERGVRLHAEEDDREKRRYARELVDFAGQSAEAESLGLVLLALAATDPEARRILRERWEKWFDLCRDDGSERSAAALAVQTVGGFWVRAILGASLGATRGTKGLRKRVRNALRKELDEDER